MEKKVETLLFDKTGEAKKPVELIKYRTDLGDTVALGPANILKRADRVVYLGSCRQDGDMFAVYYDRYISIYIGHLNDGVYIGK